jgi:predicted RNA-binding protein with PUA-like domain
LRYWLIKGRPAENDWDAMLRPGTKDRWHTSRPPKDWAFGDRVFCWESTPVVRLVGLARLGQLDCGENEDGDSLFEVEYLTRPLKSRPGIAELRTLPVLNSASFLKSGPATTVFPITPEQAELLMRLLISRNPGLETVWPDFVFFPADVLVPELEFAEHGLEGGRKWIAHFIRERNRAVIAAKKTQAHKSRGKLACEVCDFDFAERFGKLGEYFCEVHHVLPLAEADSAVVTQLDDLAIVCANCHRMLHRETPALSIQALQSLISSEKDAD